MSKTFVSALMSNRFIFHITTVFILIGFVINVLFYTCYPVSVQLLSKKINPLRNKTSIAYFLREVTKSDDREKFTKLCINFVFMTYYKIKQSNKRISIGKIVCLARTYKEH